MYAGVVLGGMGSILAAFWGGLTIGVVQQMATLRGARRCPGARKVTQDANIRIGQ
jgi:branched-subunit amino acid ABC-type transport system permease component